VFSGHKSLAVAAVSQLPNEWALLKAPSLV